MVILESAYRHGLTDDDITHLLDHALRPVEYEYEGEERLLIIGPDRHGNLREIVAVPALSPMRIIHANALRPSRYDYLR